MKNVFIKTFGCQMNVYDSGRMLDIMKHLGYAETAAPEKADIIIINTCHIREKPTEKVFSELGRFKELKQHNPNLIIIVAGCVVQAEGEEIINRSPFVDIAIGPQCYHLLPEKLEQLSRSRNQTVLCAEFPADSKFDFLPQVGKQNFSAFLAVQEGCDRFCSYCVVPYTRGAEYSRPVLPILQEAEAIVAGGAKEITLLGQNVNAWHGENENGVEENLANLIHRLTTLKGLERIRFVTSYPSDMSPALIDAFKSEAKLMPYLHLPVQSGSDKVLKAMNRRYTRTEYLDIVARLREACPHIALSSDFIVGFATESDNDFADTVDLIEKVKFASSFSFKYSPRPGTIGATMNGQIPEPVKSERLAILQALLQKQQEEFNQNTIGKTLDVLFETTGKTGNELTGHTPYMQNISVIASADKIGEILPVTVTAAGNNSLKGKLA